jgi:hypothetical protein
MSLNNEKNIAGWMIIGLIAVGIFGFIAAVLSFVNEYDHVGTGICLFASAYLFGSVLKAF